MKSTVAFDVDAESTRVQLHSYLVRIQVLGLVGPSKTWVVSNELARSESVSYQLVETMVGLKGPAICFISREV